jgi:hypothetical protein
MNKNEKLLAEFTEYCKEHPKERFFQALRNWAKFPYLCWTDKYPDGGVFPEGTKGGDTFFWEKKDK